MYNMDEIESMEMVLKSMKATKTNVEFFDMMRRGGLKPQPDTGRRGRKGFAETQSETIQEWFPFAPLRNLRAFASGSPLPHSSYNRRLRGK